MGRNGWDINKRIASTRVLTGLMPITQRHDGKKRNVGSLAALN